VVHLLVIHRELLGEVEGRPLARRQEVGGLVVDGRDLRFRRPRMPGPGIAQGESVSAGVQPRDLDPHQLAEHGIQRALSHQGAAEGGERLEHGGIPRVGPRPRRDGGSPRRPRESPAAPSWPWLSPPPGIVHYAPRPMASATMRRRDFMRASAAAATLAAAPAWAQGAPPRRGGTLRQVGFEPPTFDIHASVSFQTQLISSFVRRTLFKHVNGSKYGPSDFTLAPDIARKAEVSRDGRVYTITLRRGIRWEKKAPVNGRELVAADVKYTWERALKKSGYAHLLGKVEGVETPDSHTVRVHLAEAYAPFLHNLAEPWNAILPREVEEKMGDFKAAESLVGCGPFVLDRYEPGVKATFVRNPDYHEKRSEERR